MTENKHNQEGGILRNYQACVCTTGCRTVQVYFEGHKTDLYLPAGTIFYHDTEAKTDWEADYDGGVEAAWLREYFEAGGLRFTCYMSRPLGGIWEGYETVYDDFPECLPAYRYDMELAAPAAIKFLCVPLAICEALVPSEPQPACEPEPDCESTPAYFQPEGFRTTTPPCGHPSTEGNWASIRLEFPSREGWHAVPGWVALKLPQSH
jgi:hypothetical protein